MFLSYCQNYCHHLLFDYPHIIYKLMSICMSFTDSKTTGANLTGFFLQNVPRSSEKVIAIKIFKIEPLKDS